MRSLTYAHTVYMQQVLSLCQWLFSHARHGAGHFTTKLKGVGKAWRSLRCTVVHVVSVNTLTVLEPLSVMFVYTLPAKSKHAIISSPGLYAG